MKYVIAGASGNTGKVIAASLLEAGHSVTAVGRSAEHLKALQDKGATVAIGDLHDEAFLVKTFAGADAVYGMIPPKWDLTEPWRAFMRRIGTAITNALEISAVRHAVILSSMGSQNVPFGAGPVSGLGEWEQQLKTVRGLNVAAITPAFFMENLYAFIPVIKQAGLIGYTLPADLSLPMVHTRDIAAIAVNHLLALDFTGFKRVYVAGSKDYQMKDVSSILAKATGKDINYVQFSDQDQKQAMLGTGIPETIAENYLEMFQGIKDGSYLGDFKRTEENTTPTTLEQFSEEFAGAFRHS